jgi:hypothetical protein
MASSPEQNKQLIRQVFEFYNQQYMDKVEKLFSPKHIFHFLGVTPMDWNSHNNSSLAFVGHFQTFILKLKILFQKVIKWHIV